ncbi:hypothetical protein KQX54_020498 [Cotesia glomerata]|uniref:Uncharacterized protein n=1 Tax=Cotesia glomerata TaxID=32391 RepID=A0AAV7J8Y7_COTGL|nr:hypothetical protein KQX54_020498 [Cotesia glomerata]
MELKRVGVATRHEHETPRNRKARSREFSTRYTPTPPICAMRTSISFTLCYVQVLCLCALFTRYLLTILLSLSALLASLSVDAAAAGADAGTACSPLAHHSHGSSTPVAHSAWLDVALYLFHKPEAEINLDIEARLKSDKTRRVNL